LTVDAHAWNERYSSSELIWTADPNLFLVAETKDLPPGRALDVAAGEGRNAVWLARGGWDVTALDFSEVGLAKARALAEHARVTIDTILGDATHPVGGVYDLVVVLYLHLPEEQRRQAIAHAAAAVAPGGLLLVVGHDPTNVTAGLGGPQDPRVLFTPDDLVADLRGTGLVVQRAERVHRMVGAPDGGGTAIDALVRARRPG
jgi:SAM-dependent methyltransferase